MRVRYRAAASGIQSQLPYETFRRRHRPKIYSFITASPRWQELALVRGISPYGSGIGSEFSREVVRTRFGRLRTSLCCPAIIVYYVVHVDRTPSYDRSRGT